MAKKKKRTSRGLGVLRKLNGLMYARAMTTARGDAYETLRHRLDCITFNDPQRTWTRQEREAAALVEGCLEQTARLYYSEIPAEISHISDALLQAGVRAGGKIMLEAKLRQESLQESL